MTLSAIKNIRTVILAGGKGTRLRPLTVVFPKPLVPLGDKPILEILLNQLQSFGLKDVTICTGYLSELIMALCGNGSKFELKITYSKEESPLGTAGPLGTLDDLTDPTIVMNGDLLTNLNFNSMIEYHRQNKADITIGVYKRDVKIDFGVVESNKTGEFIGFKEKPVFEFEVSMGINILSSAAFKYIKAGKYMDMPDLILKIHQNGGRVSCYREDCYWLDIGRMDDYAKAQEEYSEKHEYVPRDSLVRDTIWITGSTGFTAGYLIDFLNNLPRKPHIIGFGRGPSGPPGLDKYYQVNINDIKSMSDIALSDTPSKVFHLASAMPPVDDPEMWHINVGGTVNLIRSIAKIKEGHVRFLNIGSAAEYLTTADDSAIYESSPAGGETVYGKTKWAQTIIALNIGKQFGIPVLVARPFNLIGPGLPRKFVAGALCAQFTDPDTEIVSVGNIKSKRDFIDVRDAVAAYWEIIREGAPGEVYNVCSGKPTSIEEIVSILSNISKSGKKVEIDLKKNRTIDLDCVYRNYDKLNRLTSWNPCRSLKESLADMLKETTRNPLF